MQPFIPALAEYLATHHHDHVTIQTPDKMHIMFDGENGFSCFETDVFDQISGTRRLGNGHSGSRFVQKKELRIASKKHGDLQPLLLTMRQLAGRYRGFVVELRKAQQLGKSPVAGTISQ